MPNKYCNLDGKVYIKEDYVKIGKGFDGVEQDVIDLQSQIDENEIDIETKVANNKTEVDGKLANHQNSATAHDGENLTFTPGTSGMAANKIGPAIREVSKRVEQIITTPVSGAAATQEIVDARGSLTKGVVYPSLDGRFEDIEKDVEKTKVPDYGTGEATSSIISLPSDVVDKGQLCDVKILGNTATNGVANGNFANSTTGWVPSGATLSVSNNILQITNNGAYTSAIAGQTLSSALIGHKMFGRAFARVTNDKCTSLRFYIATPTTRYFKIISNPVQNQWYDLSDVIASVSGDTQVKLYISHEYADVTTATGKVAEVKEVMIVDMGTSGELYSLTSDQMKQRFPYWFDGTKSTLPVRAKSVGKNRLSEIREQGNWSTSSTYVQKAATTTRVREVNPIKVMPNTVYKATPKTVSTIRYIIIYATKDDLYLTSTSWNTGALEFTIPANCEKAYVVYSYESGDITLANLSGYNLLIEQVQGQAMGVYEPFKLGGEIYTPADTVLRSVGVVKDEYSDSGKLTINTKLYTVKDSDVTSISSGSALSYVIFAKPTDFIGYNNTSYVNAQYLEGFTSQSFSVNSDPTKAYSITAINSPTSFVVGFPLGTTLQQAKDLMVGKTLFYQLANPIITPGEPQQLIAYANGTFVVDFAIKETQYYAGGIAIQSIYPIKELERVVRIDGTVRTEISLSTVTVAADGKSFTSTALSNGDYVEYVFKYVGESTLPTISYKYQKNFKAQVNANSDAIKAIDGRLNVVEDIATDLQEQLAKPLYKTQSMTPGQTVTPIPVGAGGPVSELKVYGNVRINLCPTDVSGWEQGTVIFTAGKQYSEMKSGNSARIRLVNTIRVLPSTKYVFILGPDYQFSAPQFDANGLAIKDFTAYQSSGYTFTTEPNAGYITIFIKRVDSQTILPSDITTIRPDFEIGTEIKSFISYGAKPVLPGKIKSVGRNNIDYKKAIPKALTGWNYGGTPTFIDNGFTFTTATAFYGVMIPVTLRPNTTYKFSGNATANTRVMVLKRDGMQYLVDSIPLSSGTISSSFTTGSGKDYWVVFDDAGTVGGKQVTNLQLKEGLVETPYEPFISGGELYTHGTLQAVPTARDEYSGDGVLKKSVGEPYTLVAGNITYTSEQTNTYLYYILNLSTLLPGVKLNGYEQTVFFNGVSIPYSAGSSADTQHYYIEQGSNRIYLYVNKSNVMDKTPASLINYFNSFGVTLSYLLSNPITKQHFPKRITIIPGGMVMFETATYDVGYYQNGVVHTNTAIPIKSLDYLNKIDVDTGALIPIDLSKVTVAADGLSFTITGGVKGEYYDYGWYYDSALTALPEWTLTYGVNKEAQIQNNSIMTDKLAESARKTDFVLDSHLGGDMPHLYKDTVTGKLYKLIVANGALSVQEV